MPAFVDTSCYAAIALDEPTAKQVREALEARDELWATPLLEAELLSALRREKVDLDLGDLFLGLRWALPDRPLSRELNLVFESASLRGADAWHLANALWLVNDERSRLEFLTLDERQRAVATQLGFAAPTWAA